MSTAEVLEHLDAVLKEVGETHSIPTLPILREDNHEDPAFVPTPSRQS